MYILEVTFKDSQCRPTLDARHTEAEARDQMARLLKLSRVSRVGLWEVTASKFLGVELGAGESGHHGLECGSGAVDERAHVR